MNKGVLADELKHADIKPNYKKESRNEKENYRPVSILLNLSKFFERFMHDQLNDYFDKILSKIFSPNLKIENKEFAWIILTVNE